MRDDLPKQIVIRRVDDCGLSDKDRAELDAGMEPWETLECVVCGIVGVENATQANGEPLFLYDESSTPSVTCALCGAAAELAEKAP